MVSLAGRLAKFERALRPEDRKEIEEKNAGIPLKKVVHDLLDVTDPDVPSKDNQIQEALRHFDNPEFRQLLLDIKRRNEIVIDLTPDEALPTDKPEPVQPKQVVESFEQYIKDNQDEIAALQILFNKPFKQRAVTYQQIQDLATQLLHANVSFKNETLWNAYRELYQSKVRSAKPEKILTNIVSLVRFATDKQHDLEPFPTTVEERFHLWLKDQHSGGNQFTEEQMLWLTMIKDFVAEKGGFDDELVDVFQLDPKMRDRGGYVKAQQVFGNQLQPIVEDLNQYLFAQ